jgi:hypothetical protein
MGRRASGFVSLCRSAAFLDLTLSNIEIKTSGDQTAVLEELQKVAKDNSENMSRVCASSDGPMDFRAELTAAEKRLDVALAGDRKLEPLAPR